MWDIGERQPPGYRGARGRGGKYLCRRARAEVGVVGGMLDRSQIGAEPRARAGAGAGAGAEAAAAGAGAGTGAGVAEEREGG
jgi:hypothetical protein